MFDQAPQDNDIRRVMDACLPGLENSPDFDRDVLRHVRGAIKVKKKLSVGFVLVIVLALAAVTALAAMTLNAYYEKVIEKESEIGRIQDWSTADKIALVNWMVEAGIQLEPELVASLQGDQLNDEEKEQLVSEIINGYYPARDGILTTVDIIAKDKGSIGTWSLEDKAWYSEMQAKYNHDVTNTRNILPDGDDLSEEEAVRIAFEYYQQTYGLTEAYLQSGRAENYFQECVIDDQGTIGNRWRLNFYFDGNDWPLSIEINPDGTIVWASAPYARTWRDDWYDTMMKDDFWTIEGLYRFKQEWEPKAKQLEAAGEQIDGNSDLLYLLSKPFALPRRNDLSRDEAFEKANAVILSQAQMTQEKLDFFTTREAYRTDDPEHPAFWFVYVWSYDEKVREAASIRHYEAGDIPYMMTVQIDAETGNCFDVKMVWDATLLSLSERFGM